MLTLSWPFKKGSVFWVSLLILTTVGIFTLPMEQLKLREGRGYCHTAGLSLSPSPCVSNAPPPRLPSPCTLGS